MGEWLTEIWQDLKDAEDWCNTCATLRVDFYFAQRRKGAKEEKER